ncbi:TCP-1/cpn60 family chaperonin, putative [Eimeria brunetti]|uniref:TCP-1/cpn60 family chaperonin, putative n=1 Tax=Eimeria brunetti TaxID=51314 RepID=U6LXI0_9EIME|nr:TCP-1/cpn60 family chaperonin, putative [Eimeria brunetti]
MDKLIEGENGSATITNDGATLLNLLQVKHPAAALLVDVAQSQDLEVGDGTTSVAVLAGELLQETKTLIEEGMSPQVIVKGLRAARDLMVVKAVSLLGDNLDCSQVGVKKETGGSYGDSSVIDGVAFKKTFSYAGFEQQPKKILSPKILLLNLELELKAEKENAEVRLSDPDVRKETKRRQKGDKKETPVSFCSLGPLFAGSGGCFSFSCLLSVSFLF